MEEKKTAYIAGTVIGFNDSKYLAKLKTEFGEAWIDLQCDWPLRLIEGDFVAMGDCDYYIDNGQIITKVGRSIVLNYYEITVRDLTE